MKPFFFSGGISENHSKIDIYLYICIYKGAETEKHRESTNKANRKGVWFDFHMRYRFKNIAKAFPPFSKN